VSLKALATMKLHKKFYKIKVNSILVYAYGSNSSGYSFIYESINCI